MAQKPAIHALVSPEAKSGYDETCKAFAIPISALVEAFGRELREQLDQGALQNRVTADSLDLAEIIGQAREIDHGRRGRRSHTAPE